MSFFEFFVFTANTSFEFQFPVDVFTRVFGFIIRRTVFEETLVRLYYEVVLYSHQSSPQLFYVYFLLSDVISYEYISHERFDKTVSLRSRPR